jgi:hypothetical protein
MSRAAIDDLTVPDISLPVPRDTAFAGAAICLLYLASFPLPAIDGTPGYTAFLWGGWFSAMIFGLPVTFPWLANPILWIGLVYLHKREFARAFLCGFVATILAASFFFMMRTQAHLGIGYWLWLASMASLMFASTAERVRSCDFTSETLADLDRPPAKTALSFGAYLPNSTGEPARERGFVLRNAIKRP